MYNDFVKTNIFFSEWQALALGAHPLHVLTSIVRLKGNANESIYLNDERLHHELEANNYNFPVFFLGNYLFQAFGVCDQIFKLYFYLLRKP